jgi:5S rRNA maturation endonuclease (ribonuclease M5)
MGSESTRYEGLPMKKRDPERIIEFFRELKDYLLIVEGKRDVRALNTLGLTNILAINGRPLIAIVDKVAEIRDSHKVHTVPERDGLTGKSDIIILTDFDREGRHIAARLSRLLRAHKIHPNQRLRSRIMNLGFNKVEDIRMDSILASHSGRIEKRRKGDDYVKASSNLNKVRSKSNDKGKRSGRETRYNRCGVRSD